MKTINHSKKISIGILKQKTNLLFVLIIFLTLLSSCSHYQYVSIDSNLNKNENKEFLVDNDTVTIKYAFSGENLLMAISIYNKLQHPLYIDWRRTKVILNGGQINDSFYHEQDISYIAPQSYATIISNTLVSQFININLHDSVSNVGFIKENHRNWVRAWYNEEITPLFFRNIVALTTHEDFTNPIYFDVSFWVSEILQTTRSHSLNQNLPSNQFYLRKSTGLVKVIGWSSGIATLLIWGISNSEE